MDGVRLAKKIFKTLGSIPTLEIMKQEKLWGYRYEYERRESPFYGWCLMTNHIHLIVGL